MSFAPVTQFSAKALTYHTVSLNNRASDGSWSNQGTIYVQLVGTVNLPGSIAAPSGTSLIIQGSNPTVNGVSYRFERWESSGGVSVADSNAMSTTMTATGEGSLSFVAISDEKEISLSITPASASVKPGDIATYSATVTATQIGSQDAFYLYLEASNLPPNTSLGYDGSPYVNSDQKSTTFQFRIAAETDAPVGSYEVQITAGVSGMASVTDTEEIELEIQGDICPPECADLQISDISWSPSYPTTGDTVTFSYTETNNGNADAPPHVNGYSIDASAGWFEDNALALAAGQSQTRTFVQTWTYSGGGHEVIVRADIMEYVTEDNEENNALTKVIGEKEAVSTTLSLEISPSNIVEDTSSTVTLSGRLVKSDNGDGIGSAPVILDWSGGYKPLSTDNDGSFSYTTFVGPYDAGLVTFTARFNGYETSDAVFESSSDSVILSVFETPLISTVIQLQVCPHVGDGYDCRIDSVPVSVLMRVTIKGTLINDESGEGVPDATIGVEWQGISHAARTASDGRFELSDVFTLSSGSAKFTATYAGDSKFYGASQSTFIYVQSGSKVDGRISGLSADKTTLLPGSTIRISGTLTNTGDVLSDFQIYSDAASLCGYSESSIVILQADDDADVEFNCSIHNLTEPGEYSISVIVKMRENLENSWQTKSAGTVSLTIDRISTNLVLESVSITPPSVKSGESFSGYYTIRNDNLFPVNAGLGLSIRLLPGNPVSDTSNDIIVSVKPGTHTYSRQFTLPTLDSGNYDVLMDIWTGKPGFSEQISKSEWQTGSLVVTILGTEGSQNQVVSIIRKVTYYDLEYKPLRRAEVTLKTDTDGTLTTRTDEEGIFRFENIKRLSDNGRLNTFAIIISLDDGQYVRLYDKNYFVISKQIADFSLAPDSQVGLILFSQDGENNGIDNLAGPAAIYDSLLLAGDFYKNELGISVKKVNVNLWRDDNDYFSAKYEPLTDNIYVTETYSKLATDVVWMEYTHFIQEMTFGMPSLTELIPSCVLLGHNHGGYSNACTADSMIEGLGAFMPAVIKDSQTAKDQNYVFKRYLLFPRYYMDRDLDEIWKVSDSETSRDSRGNNTKVTQFEDIAVASILWDLYTSDEKGYKKFSIQDIWQILSAKESLPEYLTRDIVERNVERNIVYLKDLYDVLHLDKYSKGEIEYIERIFEEHGAPQGKTDSDDRPKRV